jgi:hypothetical protein
MRSLARCYDDAGIAPQSKFARLAAVKSTQNTDLMQKQTQETAPLSHIQVLGSGRVHVHQ